MYRTMLYQLTDQHGNKVLAFYVLGKGNFDWDTGKPLHSNWVSCEMQGVFMNPHYKPAN